MAIINGPDSETEDEEKLGHGNGEKDYFNSLGTMSNPEICCASRLSVCKLSHNNVLRLGSYASLLEGYCGGRISPAATTEY